jgi:hypothetical protein
VVYITDSRFYHCKLSVVAIDQLYLSLSVELSLSVVFIYVIGIYLLSINKRTSMVKVLFYIYSPKITVKILHFLIDNTVEEFVGRIIFQPDKISQQPENCENVVLCCNLVKSNFDTIAEFQGW